MPGITGFSAYLREKEMRQSTISRYTAILQKYNEYNGAVLQKSALLGYKDELIRAGKKPSTVNQILAAIRMYGRYVGQTAETKSVRVRRSTTAENVITREQYDSICTQLSASGCTSQLVLVWLLARTGVRISEAVRITKADVLRGSAAMDTKRAVRTIQIPACLRNDLSNLLETLENTDTVLRNRYGKPMSQRTAQQELHRIGTLCGIPQAVMHPHSFRHFFAINFLRNNGNIALLADLLGHQSINTTMIYLRMSQEQQQRAIDAAVDW